jgi:hypothetical protein
MLFDTMGVILANQEAEGKKLEKALNCSFSMPRRC